VVAIGGILADDVPEILAAGVAGIAMSGALLNAPSPAGETKRILQLIERKQLI
jgi:thiamine monophosphate synthase